jgi:hypothetical protein
MLRNERRRMTSAVRSDEARIQFGRFCSSPRPANSILRPLHILIKVLREELVGSELRSETAFSPDSGIPLPLNQAH